MEVRGAGAAGAPADGKPGKRRRHKKPPQESTEDKGKATHRIITATLDHTPNILETA